MPNFEKSPKDVKKINSLASLGRELFTVKIYDIARVNPDINAQMIFNEMMEIMYDPRGSIFLCFGCGSVLKRREVREESCFHINRVWHPCYQERSGVTTVVPGINTRYHLVLEYIREKIVNDKSSIINGYILNTNR